MRAIVLQSIRYSDSQRVVKLFTEAHGLKSYLIRARKQKSGSGLNGIHPFALLEINEQERRKGQLGALKDFRREVPLTGLMMDPSKSAVAMFGAEMLARSIAEDHAHPELFNYLWHAIQQLDLDEWSGLYAFLVCGRIIRFLGLMPEDVAGEAGEWSLDIQRAAWIQGRYSGDQILNPEEVAAFVQSSRVTAADFSTLQLPLKSRRKLLDAMARYLQAHVCGPSPVKSLEVLREVFG